MSANFTERVVDLVNAQRKQADLDPLRVDSQLAQAAQNHSRSMASQDFFSHTGANGSTPFERILKTGYEYRAAGENLAAGYTTPEAVVSAWMNSPGHRDNILNPQFTEIGTGYKFLANDTGSVNYGHYWSLSLGTPL